MTAQGPPAPVRNLWLRGKNSSQFGSRAVCRRSTPGVRLLPSFSHSELVIQALTLPVTPMQMPQPSRLHGGCSGEGEEHTCSRARLRAPGGKPAMLLSHCTSQLLAQLGQWGCHPLPWGHLGP